MEVLGLFHEATARWFAAGVGEPTAVQREAWPAIAGGDVYKRQELRSCRRILPGDVRLSLYPAKARFSRMRAQAARALPR